MTVSDEWVRSLKSFESDDWEGYQYYDGFGELRYEICDVRTKDILGAGNDMLEALIAATQQTTTSTTQKSR